MTTKYFKFLPGVTTAVVILFILYLSFLVLKSFLFVIVLAFIFAIFLNPVYEWFNFQLKRKTFAAILSIVLLLLCIFLPLSFILGAIVQEARSLLDLLQKNPTLLFDAQNAIATQLQSYGFPPYLTQLNLQNEAVGLLKTIIQNIGTSLFYAGSVFINTFFVLITTFFFLIKKKAINGYLMDIEILPYNYFIRLKERTIEVVNGIVRGNLLVVAIQIVVGMTGFFMFGVSTPILLGVLYGLFSLLPGIGVLMIWAPIAIILFLSNGLFFAILFVLWFVLSNLAIDNFVAPKIIGGKTKLHQLLIMFSVIGGIQQFGFIGIFLGPVVVALGFVAVSMYKELVEESKIV